MVISSATIVGRVVIRKTGATIKIVAVIVEIGIIRKMIVVQRIFRGVTRRALLLDLQTQQKYLKAPLELFNHGKKAEIKERSIGLNRRALALDYFEDITWFHLVSLRRP